MVKDLDLALFFILDIKTEKIIKKCPEKCVNILVKDLDLALFFILDIKTEKIIKKCPEKCPETANYYTTIVVQFLFPLLHS